MPNPPAVAYRILELAGWLHNFSKLSSAFVGNRTGLRDWITGDGQSQKFVASAQLRYGLLNGLKRCLQRAEFDELGELEPGFKDDTLVRLIEEHTEKNPDHLLVKLMVLSHRNASGAEKRSVQRERRETEFGEEWGERDPSLAPQKGFPFFRHSPFGYVEQAYATKEEADQYQKDAMPLLLEALHAISDPGWRGQDKIREALDKGLADTQLPLLDVRISDISLMAGAFLKAAAAQYWICKRKPEEIENIQWRLYRVFTDSDLWVEAAVRLADVSARRKWLAKCCDDFAVHVADRQPYLTRVYRDADSLVFLGPASDEPFVNEFNETVKWWRDGDRREIPMATEWSKAFALGAGAGYAHQLGWLLKESRTPGADSYQLPQLLVEKWKHQGDICLACSCRPVYTDRKENPRRLCGTCLERSETRVKDWLEEGLSSTIWVDELADRNGRIALLSGEIPIYEWLIDGGFLEESCFLERLIPDRENPRNIPPSAARCQRIIETLEDFWKGCEGKIRAELLRQNASARRRVARCEKEVWTGELKNFLAYELKHGGKEGRSSVLFYEGRFIFLARAGRPEQEGKSVEVFESGGYGSEPSEAALASGRITFDQGDQVAQTAFARYLRVRLDAREFQCFVPAAQARACARLILEAFAEQMASVRNRLGLQLSIMAGPGRTPVRAYLDGARRAQARRPKKLCKTIAQIAQIHVRGKRSERLKAVHIALEGDADGLLVPLEMDLSATYPKGEAAVSPFPDSYFPYFNVNPEGEAKWMHASDLQRGQRVEIVPSTVDFEFLDSASRRFELRYDPDGRRQGSGEAAEDRTHRPCTLDGFLRLDELIATLGLHFSTRQIRRLDALLAEKARAWRMRVRELPEDLVATVLSQLEERRPVPPGTARELAAAAKAGLLEDAIEFVAGIEKNQQEEDG